MGPIWVLSAPDGPHVGPMNLAIRDIYNWSPTEEWIHYNDVIMTTIASQITSLTIVYSTVYSDADQSKHRSSASLAFVWGIHRHRWIPRTKGQLRGKCFHLMTSSCHSKCNVCLQHKTKHYSIQIVLAEHLEYYVSTSWLNNFKFSVLVVPHSIDTVLHFVLILAAISRKASRNFYLFQDRCFRYWLDSFWIYSIECPNRDIWWSWSTCSQTYDIWWIGFNQNACPQPEQTKTLFAPSRQI